MFYSLFVSSISDLQRNTLATQLLSLYLPNILLAFGLHGPPSLSLKLKTRL